MKKYIAPEAELLLLASPDIMNMSDENSLFVDILDKNED